MALYTTMFETADDCTAIVKVDVIEMEESPEGVWMVKNA